MAKFCDQCGKELKDGEVCNCIQNKVQKSTNENVQNDTEPSNGNGNSDVGSIIKGISDAIGSFLDKIYYSVTPKDKSSNKSSAIALRKLLTFSQEDYIKPLENVYERGARITPDLVQPCSDETIIRQYDICTVRAAIKGLWQDGKLLVTNKRILFRLSGRNWLGKEQTSKEFEIDDIAGIDMSYSSKINLGSALINIILGIIPMFIGALIGSAVPLLGAILGLILFLFFLIFLRGHHIFKFIVFFTCIALMSGIGIVWGSVGGVIVSICLIITIVQLYLASLRPHFTFKVMTKSIAAAPISAGGMGIFSGLPSGIFGAILPGKDADRAMDELGAMISDIKEYGELGVNKWKAL